MSVEVLKEIRFSENVNEKNFISRRGTYNMMINSTVYFSPFQLD